MSATTAAHWTRETFYLAVAHGPHSATVDGYVLRVAGAPLWGLSRHGRKWSLTHWRTGAGIACTFATLADGKRFAEELSAEMNCDLGRFGKSLRGVRGSRALLVAVKRQRERYGFAPVVPIEGVEYGPKEVAR